VKVFRKKILVGCEGGEFFKKISNQKFQIKKLEIIFSHPPHPKSFQLRVQEKNCPNTTIFVPNLSRF
jgi:hypothetical protein